MSHPHSMPPIPRRVLVAWGCLFGLFFVEASVFTLFYDGQALEQVDAFWARLILSTRFIVPCAIAMAAGLVLFGSEVLLEALRKHRGSLPLRWPLYLGVHALAVLVFFRVSGRLFSDPPSEPSQAVFGLMLWGVSGFMLIASLLPLFLPLAMWRFLSRRGVGKLLLGVSAGVLAWTAGQAGQQGLWRVVGEPTLSSVRSLLSLLMPESVVPASGTYAGTHDFIVRVGSGCSGVEGIGLVWIFVSFYLWIARDRLRFPRALWLLPLATLCVWSANVVRIVGLIMIGDLWSPRIALDAFHTRMGWIFFCSIALGILALSERSGFFMRQRRSPRAFGAEEPNQELGLVLAFVLPLLAVLATQLLGGAFLLHASDVYPASLLVGLLALWRYRRSYACLRLEWSWCAAGAGLLVFVIWVGLEQTGPTTESSRALTIYASEAARGPLISSAHILSSVVIAPLAEELAFRGYIMRRLIRTQASQVRVGAFTLYSCLASSLLFGLTHDRWFVGTLAGLVYALVLYRKQNLAHSVLAHAVTNGLLVLYAFAG